MRYFDSGSSAKELKERYWELAKQHHPDMPTGNTVVMQEINREYDQLSVRHNSLSGNGVSDFSINENDIQDFISKIKASDVIGAVIKTGLALWLIHELHRQIKKK